MCVCVHVFYENCIFILQVKIWHIPEGGLTESLANAEYALPQFDKRVENVLFHPTTEFILTVAYFDTVKLWDIKHEKELFCKLYKLLSEIFWSLKPVQISQFDWSPGRAFYFIDPARSLEYCKDFSTL